MSEYNDLRDIVKFSALESPLSYPGGTRASPFKAPWRSTVKLLGTELRMHGARHPVMEIDMAPANIRQDGTPRADRQARSPGIVLSFQATTVPNSPELRYEVTTFTDWRDNVRAVAMGLERLRAVDRYGITRRGEQYAGWKQLAAGDVGDGDAKHGRVLIAAAGGKWQRAAAMAHPDLGGAPNDFRDVIAARDEARALESP